MVTKSTQQSDRTRSLSLTYIYRWSSNQNDFEESHKGKWWFSQKAKKAYSDSRGRRKLNNLNTELQDVHRIMVEVGICLMWIRETIILSAEHWGCLGARGSTECFGNPVTESDRTVQKIQVWTNPTPNVDILICNNVVQERCRESKRYIPYCDRWYEEWFLVLKWLNALSLRCMWRRLPCHSLDLLLGSLATYQYKMLLYYQRLAGLL